MTYESLLGVFGFQPSMHIAARFYGLGWAETFAHYGLWPLMTYLIDVWKLSSSHAAGVLNVVDGAKQTLPVILVFFLRTLGSFRVLLTTSIAYTIGLGFMAMSTPPVTGSCSEYKEECIGRPQKALFYTGLALIAVGVADRSVSYLTFYEDQLTPIDDDENEHHPDKFRARIDRLVRNEDTQKEAAAIFAMLCCKMMAILFASFFTVGGAIALQFIKPWSLKFGIPAIAFLLATIVFSTISCSKSYKFYKPEPEFSSRIVPILLTFIVCGQSMGNTYFLDQANNMNRHLGRIKVPLTILQVFFEFISFCSRGLYRLLAFLLEELANKRKYAPPIGIAVAMIFSILCCITAAKIEVQRLDVITNHGLLDKPEENIPLTVFKLLPQYILLGVFNGIFKASTNDFLRGQDQDPMSRIFIGGMSGLGSLTSVLLVHILGKFRETNWFHETSNRNRLDKFYWLLSVVSAVNLVFYIVVATTCYSYGDQEESEEELELDAGRLQRPLELIEDVIM